MIRIRKASIICVSMCVVFLVMVLSGCERSPQLYCTEEADSQDYEKTGLTLKDVMNHLEKHKITYKYDEKEKVLQFDTAAIYFKDHPAGLVAFKARQKQPKMEEPGLSLFQPQGDIVLNPCKLLSLMKR